MSANYDCTHKCKSKQHAKSSIAAITQSESNEKIASYLYELCLNFQNLIDESGKTVLHVASSCSKKFKLLEWLIKNCKSDVLIKDKENGWTALHRSFYFGQISSALLLIKNGASLTAFDHDGHTPVDLAMKDIQSNKLEVNLAEVFRELYIFGSNSNYNLGDETQQNLEDPSLQEFFFKEKISIAQVAIQKFHSIFLSDEGIVYSCGHGQDGRLGVGSEQTRIIPSVMKLPLVKGEKIVISQIAGGDNHTILLSSSGEVYTCGLNNCHQLGLPANVDKVLIPSRVHLPNSSNSVISVHAAAFHSVICYKDSIFTCGLNSGQIGHTKGSRTQPTFRMISQLNHKDISISHVSTSYGATICVVNSKFIYVFYEYKFKKLPPFFNISKVQVIGGKLDKNCDPSLVNKIGSSVQVCILNNEGNIYFLDPSTYQITRCFFCYPRQPFITDFSLHLKGILIITNQGEGFSGTIIRPSSHAKQHKKSTSTQPSESSQKSLESENLAEFREKSNCYQINLQRLANVHRGLKIFSNLEGKSYSLMQYKPFCRFEFDFNSNGKDLGDNLKELMDESYIGDGIQDVVIQVEKKSYPLHRYILASRSPYLRKLILEKVKDLSDKTEDLVIKLENLTSVTFEALLHYIYFGDASKVQSLMRKSVKDKDKNRVDCCCNIDTRGLSAFQVKQKRELINCPACNETATSLNIFDILRIYGFKSSIVTLQNMNSKEALKKFELVSFQYDDLPELSDITINSCDGKKFSCHKCIFIARSEYFRGMFSCNWIEGTKSYSLDIKVSNEILMILLKYLYKNKINLSKDQIKDLDFMVEVLIMADQYLFEDLRNHCQLVLIDLVSLKNVAEILQVSIFYDTEMLTEFCLMYICENLPALIEYRSLEQLDEEILERISETYQKVIPNVRYRTVTPLSMSVEDCNLLSNSKSLDLCKSDVRNKQVQILNRSRNHSQRSFSTSSMKQIQRSQNIDSSMKPTTQDPMDGDETKLSEDFSAVTITSKEEKLLDTPIVQSEFPKLGNLKNLNSSSTNNRTKLFSKSSQKQRKKLNLLTDDKIIVKKEENQPSSCPWQELSSPKEVKTPSFKDILQKEQETKSPELVETPNKFVRWNKTAANPNKNSNNGYVHPWENIKDENHTAVSSSKDVNVSFTDILHFEEQAFAQLKETQNKSLDLIQIEDKAIEDLRRYYKADENPDELIIIQRVPSNYKVSPIWKKKF